MSGRRLLAGGFVCILLSAATLFVGSAASALLVFVFLGIGVALLFAGFVRARKGPARAVPPKSDPRRARTPIVVRLLGAVAIATAVVAAVVAVGDARGHAVSHLLVGLLCFGLFAVLTFLWHPEPGSRGATFRSFASFILAVGAFGSFVESLGGAGYDAANAERRIPALASLHGVGMLFGPIAYIAVPIGIATCLVLLLTNVANRVRSADR